MELRLGAGLVAMWQIRETSLPHRESPGSRRRLPFLRRMVSVWDSAIRYEAEHFIRRADNRSGGRFASARSASPPFDRCPADHIGSVPHNSLLQRVPIDDPQIGTATHQQFPPPKVPNGIRSCAFTAHSRMPQRDDNRFAPAELPWLELLASKGLQLQLHFWERSRKTKAVRMISTPRLQKSQRPNG